MNCPFCSEKDTKVVDSRLLPEENIIKRRRKCELCHKRFTTFERIELALPHVIKNDGRREEYKREKIMEGINKACHKRPVSTANVEKMVNLIERAILELNYREVTTREIGDLVMHYIRYLDPVAYVRFASVYRTFKDVNEFVNDLKLDEDKGPQSE